MLSFFLKKKEKIEPLIRHYIFKRNRTLRTKKKPFLDFIQIYIYIYIYIERERERERKEN